MSIPPKQIPVLLFSKNAISELANIIMVAGAILAGYISCLLQHGLGSSLFSKKRPAISKPQNHTTMNKPALVVESLKEETDAGWPSPGRLISDLAKFAIEAIGNSLLNLIIFPQTLLPRRKGLTPLKDNLIIPEDKSEPPPLVQKQTNASDMMETLNSSNINTDTTSIKHQKSSKPPKYKDSSLVSKHRSSKRQDYTDFYSTEASQMGSKSQKDRTRHRHREKPGEMVFGVTGTEPKAVEAKPKDYNNEQKFDHYNMNNKYGTDSSYRF